MAVFLSFVAGLVNICGVLALGVLTTNVTGHFAYFAEDVTKRNEFYGAWFLLYIIAFLSGAFVSGLLTEFSIYRQRRAQHNASIFLEILTLSVMGIYGDQILLAGFDKRLLACFLLFTMGLQNSLVSKISNFTLRTTHLTGLFTDLGIELSQLFFYRKPSELKKLSNSIFLRLGIVAFFFSGCVIGGFLFIAIKFRVLLLAAFVMILAFIYDNMLLGIYKLRKNLSANQ